MKNFHPLRLIAFFIFVSHITSVAQPEIFAFAYDASGRSSDGSVIAEDKISVAEEVFEKLVEAKGVRNMPKPIFELQNSEQRPAWIDPKERRIVLEEKAFDICMKLGKDSLNALAALISHELIHYYEKHDWKEHFLHANNNLASADKLAENNSGLSLELQADHLGGLLAHMAGYNTLGVMPDLLGEIYKSYNLLNVIDPNYPSIEERRTIARNSDKLLTKHSRLFDMALYFTAAGEYDQATSYLEFLLNDTKFQSREIYNNLAVLSMLEAIQLMPASQLIFHYPIELEFDSRLSSRAVRDPQADDLLRESIEYLETAKLLDETHAKSILNMAIAYALLGESEDATYFANKANKLFENQEQKKGMEDVQILKGILAADDGKISEAKQLFNIPGNELARLNLCKLESNNDCSAADKQKRLYKKNVDNVNLDKLYARIMRDQEQALLNIDINDKLSFHTIAKENSEILVSLDNEIVGNYALFQIVTHHGLNYSDAIGLGTHRALLTEELGEPDKIYGNGVESLFVYKSLKAIFKFDSEDKISEWALYKLSL